MHQPTASTFPDMTVKPFRIGRMPDFPLAGAQLAEDVENAARNHADVIGCALFQSRDDALDTFTALVESEQYRSKLGRGHAAPFAALAGQEPEARKIALALVEIGMNRMIEACAAHLAAGERMLPGGYCVRYKVESQLMCIAGVNANGVKLTTVARAAIANTLSNAFGRWLRMFGGRRATGHSR